MTTMARKVATAAAVAAIAGGLGAGVAQASSDTGVIRFRGYFPTEEACWKVGASYSEPSCRGPFASGWALYAGPPLG